MALRDELLSIAQAFLTAFNKFTPESVVAYRSTSCKHRLLPATLQAPPRSNAEYAAFVKQLQVVMPSFHLRLSEDQDPVVDEATRTVVMHLKSHSETDIGLYENEYIWILKFNGNGTAIDEVIEFADSQYTTEWIPKFQKAVEDKQKPKI
ncbi:hypothetical protein DL771_001446 [Monosporascus sp. 5C6A]|nr:hypothetical protein DL771_001446 [Monosporascus sp. 5C6A]